MGTCSSTPRRHGFLMLAVLVILSLGATAALAGAPSARVFQSPPPQPPPNDNFANATVISEPLPFTGTSNTTYATIEASEPQFCTGLSGTVWYTFTPTVAGVYEADTPGSDTTYLTIVRGTSLSSLELLGCDSAKLAFSAEAGATYYFQLGTHSAFPPGAVTLNLALVPPPPPPPNDNFADALSVSGLPYDDIQNIEGATMEPNESAPSCAWYYPTRSIWYSYTPTANASVTAVTHSAYEGFSVAMAAYTGDRQSGFSELGCRPWYDNPLTIQMQTGVTYHFQVTNIYGNEYGGIRFHMELTPPPVADFNWWPSDANRYDTVTFCDSSYDPGNLGISKFSWDFGDGATSTENCVSHQYAADGDYAVLHTVTTIDGRTGSTSKVVQVRTHDVAITKFTVPQSASVGQTRQIVVGLRNYAYAENVRVELYKSMVGGDLQVGWLLQQVPVRSGNRTTDFNFSYTFTSDDAKMGKVTFRAVAWIDNGRDALPADNTAISSPVKVSGKK